MTPAEKKKLIGNNAGIWTLSILASFILPSVAVSVSSGNAGFLKLLCFALPLIVGMVTTTILIGKAVTESSD